MPEYLSPGVYTEERAAGPAVIQGVSTSTYATVGWTQRGPVGVATLTTSNDEFVTKFGAHWAGSYIPFAIAGFFGEGGSRAYVVREVPSDAVKASGDIDQTASGASFIGRTLTDPITTLDATHYNIKVQVDAFAATEIDVTADLGVGGSYALSAVVGNINTALNAVDVSLANTASVSTAGGGNRLQFVSPTTGVSSKVEFTAPASVDCTLELTGLDITGYPHTFLGVDAVDRWDLDAENEGAWGNLVRVVLQGDPNWKDNTNGGWTKFKVFVQEESSDGGADWDAKETFGPVNLDTPTGSDYFLDVVNASSERVVVTAGATPGIPRELAPVQWTDEYLEEHDGAATSFSGIVTYAEVVRGSLSIADGTVTAQDQGDGTLTGTGIVSGTINYLTGAWAVVFSASQASGTRIEGTYKQQSSADTASSELSGGADGTGPLTRTEVSDPTLEATDRGVYALNKLEELLNISLPDFAGTVTVANDVISWAENRKDRFFIMDPASALTPQEVLDYRQVDGNYNTSYAALYYPWVTVPDPTADNRPADIPPSGHVAGVYARTDQNRNVGKAPAGLNDGKLVTILGVERELSKGERDILNPASINAIVDSPQTGRAVWGARTLEKAGDFLYINVRRLFMFVEKSVFLATHWAVFENNNSALRAKIRMSLNGFLLTLHDAGYFAGTVPADSFNVVCDESNNPPHLVAAGQLICDVYLAPNKPGEFIRFRFSQLVNQTG
jgi:phage tail sheath protein FI